MKKDKFYKAILFCLGIVIVMHCSTPAAATTFPTPQIGELPAFNNYNAAIHMTNEEALEHFEEFMASQTRALSINDYYSVEALDAFVEYAVDQNIIKDTPLETMYNNERFHILTKEEYIDIVIEQLELLDERIVIHRITADPDPKTLIEPTWLLKKVCLLNDIDKEMKKRNTYQGIKS